MALSSTSFKKGSKGGPGGARPGVGRKPDDVARFREDLRQGFGYVLGRLKRHAGSKNEEISVRACIWWADQVIGKAVQNVQVDAGGAQVSAVAECDQAIVAAIRDCATAIREVGPKPARRGVA